jgi:hypothetical protein
MGKQGRGMICLSLAVGLEEDRARLGLTAAVDRLRDALAYNGLTLDGDEKLLAGMLTGEVTSEELAEAICSSGGWDCRKLWWCIDRICR